MQCFTLRRPDADTEAWADSARTLSREEGEQAREVAHLLGTEFPPALWKSPSLPPQRRIPGWSRHRLSD